MGILDFVLAEDSADREAGILVIGLICNILVRPVADKHFMTPQQEGELDAAGTRAGVVTAPAGPGGDGAPRRPGW